MEKIRPAIPSHVMVNKIFGIQCPNSFRQKTHNILSLTLRKKDDCLTSNLKFYHNQFLGSLFRNGKI